MNPIETIKGQIVAKANNYQAVPAIGEGKRIIKNANIRRYEYSFALQCKKYKGMGIDTPFELVANIYYKSKSFDLDNSVKTLLDCLQQVNAIKNDNLCRRINVEKFIDKSNPRVEFAILCAPKQRNLFDQ